MTDQFQFSLYGATATVVASDASDGPAGIRALAESLMERHGLSEWTLVFDRAVTRAGQCRYRAREISLSAPLMSQWTREQCTNTILHEIAHALTPEDGGHGAEWRAMCRRMGIQPERCWGDNGEQEIRGRHVGTCPNGHVIYRHKLTQAARNGSCAVCSPRLDRRYRFTWTVSQ